MNEPFLTYRFQGFRFEFVKDEIHITNERHLPFYEKYKLIFTNEHLLPPFTIILEEKGQR